MAEKTLKAGVIGLGVGRTHIQGYQAAGAEVVAIADVVEAGLRKAQDQYGVSQGYTDYQELLARDDVDTVSICTPDRLHAEHVLAALEAGKHVLCEKPMALTVDDAASIVKRVRETGLKFMMCHNYRFVPQFALLKERLDTGILGDVFYADSSYVQDLYSMESLGKDYWRFADPQDLYLGGAVHNVDLMLWLLGEIEEVSAYSKHAWKFYPIDENYVSNFKFANGCIGRVLLVLGAKMKDGFFVDLNVYGAGGALKTTMHAPELVINVGALEGETPEVVAVEKANAHHRAIAHFVECVREDKMPSITVEDGARAVAVCLAVIESARECRPVRIAHDLV